MDTWSAGRREVNTKHITSRYNGRETRKMKELVVWLDGDRPIIRHTTRQLDYISKQHSTTWISLFMRLTGRERAMPLTFYYLEYEVQ